MGDENEEFTRETQEENKLYGDILFVPVKESYRSIPLQCIHAYVFFDEGRYQSQNNGDHGLGNH
jgi:hypothetical protein